MSTKSNNGILLAILIAVGIAALIIRTQNKTPTVIVEPQVALKEAEINGIRYSSIMANIRRDIQKLQDDGTLTLTIRPGKLTNPILGQTSVIINNAEGKIECTVVMDIEDAVRAGDRVEPLLGHELKHVWDALFLYDKTDPYTSAAKFIETANRQKGNTLYKEREVESSAIGIENSIRKELKATKNPIFSSLPESREAADVMYANRSKVDINLRPKY